MTTTTAKKEFRITLQKYWLTYTLGIFAMLLTSSAEVAVPRFIQWSLDLFTSPQTAKLPDIFRAGSISGTHNNLMIGMLIALIFGWLGRIGWRQVFARRTHDSGYHIKNRIWDSLKDQPRNFFYKYPLGDLMNRAAGDWNKSRFIHGFTMVITFDVIFFFTLAIASMMLIDVELTILSLIIVPFLPKFISRLATREYKEHTEAQESLSELSDLISQNMQTIRLQRATATEAPWLSRLNDSAQDYAHKRFKTIKTGWQILPLGAAPTLFTYLILLTFGVYKINAGEITIGEFVALQSYVLLFQGPLFELGEMISEWQTGFASYSRIVEIFNHSKSKFSNSLKSPSEITTEYAIELENVAAIFEDGKNTIFKNINLNIPSGIRIGIVGEIGSGKSTLLKQITGQLDPSEGKIRIFGHDIISLERQWLTKKVTVVPQKTFLFSGTIRQNLELDRQYTNNDLWEVLQLVQLKSDVERFSDKLDTWVGEWGINLSGGQKQRLALARALLRKSPVLILDDCLSAIDAVTEEIILDNLNRCLPDNTIVWVAHRASTLVKCDQVYKFDQGYLKQISIGGATQ
ncbi:MAG: hypothetical protein CMP10_06230 [Zetaproteobacteria bacterium]|nr:hypothetical protein [Pseudobdellovibrionaceae bacterium]